MDGNQDDSLSIIRNSNGEVGSCSGKILLEAADTPTRCYLERNFDTTIGITVDTTTRPLNEKKVTLVNAFIYIFQFKNDNGRFITQYITKKCEYLCHFIFLLKFSI